jgi:hypothetical protein
MLNQPLFQLFLTELLGRFDQKGRQPQVGRLKSLIGFGLSAQHDDRQQGIFSMDLGEQFHPAILFLHHQVGNHHMRAHDLHLGQRLVPRGRGIDLEPLFSQPHRQRFPHVGIIVYQ